LQYIIASAYTRIYIAYLLALVLSFPLASAPELCPTALAESPGAMRAWLVLAALTTARPYSFRAGLTCTRTELLAKASIGGSKVQ